MIPHQKKEHVFKDPNPNQKFSIPKEFWIGFVGFPIICIIKTLVLPTPQAKDIFDYALWAATPFIGGAAATIGWWSWREIWRMGDDRE